MTLKQLSDRILWMAAAVIAASGFAGDRPIFGLVGIVVLLGMAWETRRPRTD